MRSNICLWRSARGKLLSRSRHDGTDAVFLLPRELPTRTVKCLDRHYGYLVGSFLAIKDLPMTKRAAIYTRVSSQQQAGEDKTSLKTQLEDCRKLAEKKGFEIIAELRDIKTGTDRKRKGFLELCRMVEANEIDAVIAWKEDRLYRGPIADTLYDAISERREVEIMLVVGIFDRSMMAISAGIAQKELEGIQERMEGGMRARLREGRVGTGKPKFGYKTDAGGYPEVDETDAGFVNDIFEMYIMGFSWRELMYTLKAKGCNRKWHRMTLLRIVKDRTYVDGVNLVARKVVFPEEIFEIHYPKIIDKVTFGAAQDKLEANRNRDRSHHLKYPALCQGLIRCETHDYGMRLVRRKRNHGKVVEKIYRCDWHHEHKWRPVPTIVQRVCTYRTSTLPYGQKSSR